MEGLITKENSGVAEGPDNGEITPVARHCDGRATVWFVGEVLNFCQRYWPLLVTNRTQISLPQYWHQAYSKNNKK